MINYRDGFVRRGLLGEVIRFFSGATGISVIIVIQTICVRALVFVICYFFRRFYKMDLNWWIIASPLLCGTAFFFIRKDWMLYALLIGICSLLKNDNPGRKRGAIALVLAIVGLLTHEAFFFWGIPVVILRWSGIKQLERKESSGW